jgi:PAS domain S-box-containing protein
MAARKVVAKTLTEKEQLLETNRLLEAILHSASEGIVVADGDGRFILWNEAAKKIVGIGPKNTNPQEYPTLYGCYKDEECTQMFTSEELPLFRAIRGDIFRNVEMFLRNENNPNGTWILCSGRPLRDVDGNHYQGGVLMFRDITEKMRARRGEQYYRQFYDSVPVGFYTTSIKDGTFVRANRYCVQMLGFDTFEEMALRVKAKDLYVNPEDRIRLINEIKVHGQVNHFETELKLLNGEKKWIQLSASLCLCENCCMGAKHPECQRDQKACFEGLFCDITEKKNMEIELQSLKSAHMESMRELHSAIESKLQEYRA